MLIFASGKTSIFFIKFLYSVSVSPKDFLFVLKYFTKSSFVLNFSLILSLLSTSLSLSTSALYTSILCGTNSLIFFLMPSTSLSDSFLPATLSIASLFSSKSLTHFLPAITFSSLGKNLLFESTLAASDVPSFTSFLATSLVAPLVTALPTALPIALEPPLISAGPNKKAMSGKTLVASTNV